MKFIKFYTTGLLILAVNLFSQEIILTSALVSGNDDSLSTYLFPIDPVEFSLISSPDFFPKPGYDSLTTMQWDSVQSDSTGWYNHEMLKGGYLAASFNSDKNKTMLLDAMSADLVYANGIPRIANKYKFKDFYEDWEPKYEYGKIPVKIQQGQNRFILKCSYGQAKLTLSEIPAPVFLNTSDLTLPDIPANELLSLSGSILLNNGSDQNLSELSLNVFSKSGISAVKKITNILALSATKISFPITGPPIVGKTSEAITIRLQQNDKTIDEVSVKVPVIAKGKVFRRTYQSRVDGSVQYYAINPPSNNSGKKALLLSLHGANVEALNQAKSYFPKAESYIIAPTNRRPFGYNWEDWGRTDALQVLEDASKYFQINPDRIYLSGHSMGGHGVWHLASIFPAKFAAIGPSAAWNSFWEYRPGKTFSVEDPAAEMLMRSANLSQTYEMASNLENTGIYVIHGTGDDNVPVEQSDKMIGLLQGFHKDFRYHRQEGAGHWWDLSDKPGADCVDWAPMFDFFEHHAVPQTSMTSHVRFKTANPAVSARHHWVTIEMQEKQFDFSEVDITYHFGAGKFTGTTKNVKILSLDLSGLDAEKYVSVVLDNISIEDIPVLPGKEKLWMEKRGSSWRPKRQPTLYNKGPHRYGLFKSAFDNNVVLVVGTAGTEAENTANLEKAKYDAEIFWYQGNGSPEIILDSDFKFAKYSGRNIIIYGNSVNNLAWEQVLADSPVQVASGEIKIDTQVYKGDDLGILFICPNSANAGCLVGVVGASGAKGMRLLNLRPYLYSGYGFPDLVLFNADLPRTGSAAVLASGFFGEDWTVQNGEFYFRAK